MNDGQTGRSIWRQRVNSTPDREFLVGEQRTLTFGEADLEARLHAAVLESVGIAAGDRVLVGMNNRIETVITQIALRELGAVLVPLLPGLTPDELIFQAGHSGAEYLVVEDPVSTAVAARLSGETSVRKVILADSDSESVFPEYAASLARLQGADPLPVRQLEIDDLSPSMILYTSGSTGKPKGVVVPAGALPSTGEGYAERFRIDPEDNYFLPLTLAHAAGAITAQGIAIQAGCRLTVVDRFSPSVFWEQVERTGATVSILFASHMNLLSMLDEREDKNRETPMRLVISHMWIESFRQRFGVDLGLTWGMTETGATSVLSEPDHVGHDGDGYIGTPQVGVEIAIFEGDRPLGPGEIGEIAHRHPHVMLGYLDEPEATDATLQDGWIRSGDLGTLNEQGELFYVGRIKGMIKRSGENVSPEEVELALVEHEKVAECVVFGVPDALRTEEVSVVIVADGERPDPAELCEFVGTRLARWKVPRYVTLSDTQLPRLANGKVDRNSVIESVDETKRWDREQQRRAPVPANGGSHK